MPSLPQGTVTFAFTDIEGSTRLLKALGPRYADLLTEHRSLVRATFAARGGVEIDTQGDAFFYAFPRASEAVAAAAEVERAHAAHAWPDGVTVRVRIGLHTGEPTVSDEGYVGLDVVRAARLCGSCLGGQVLLSQTTRTLVGSALPDGVGVYPLGQRHLKDIDEPEVVYELEIDGVERAPEPAAPAPTAAEPAAPAPAAAAPQPAAGAELGQRIEAWAESLSARIEGRVARSIGGMFRDGDAGAEAPPSSGDLSAEIEAMVERALRGLPPKPGT
jgi:class 3 adenylate cyclase